MKILAGAEFRVLQRISVDYYRVATVKLANLGTATIYFMLPAAEPAGIPYILVGHLPAELRWGFDGTIQYMDAFDFESMGQTPVVPCIPCSRGSFMKNAGWLYQKSAGAEQQIVVLDSEGPG